MTDRIKCTNCDNQILEATARKNNGLCAICKRDKDRADFDAVVQGWKDNPKTLPGTHGIPEPESISLRMAASQLKSRLYPEADDIQEAVCHEYFAEALNKWTKYGSAVLSQKEKYTLAVETFYGEVTNGGLLQYLGNQSGAFAEWAVDAFEAIGIPAYANIVRNVKSLFPNGIIPENPDTRLDLVESIATKRLEAMEQPFWDQYRKDNKEIRRKLFQYLNA